MILKNEQETLDLGAKFAKKIYDKKVVISLEGDLGAGKSTFARGFIQYFGFDKVKSPTYSIVETYKKDKITIHHFDIYRCLDPEELEFIGIRDYQENAIMLIEWAKKGKGFLPKADLIISLKEVEKSRKVTFIANSKIGEKCLEELF